MCQYCPWVLNITPFLRPDVFELQAMLRQVWYFMAFYILWQSVISLCMSYFTHTVICSFVHISSPSSSRQRIAYYWLMFTFGLYPTLNKILLTHSLTHPPTHSLTHSLTHPLTHSPSYLSAPNAPKWPLTLPYVQSQMYPIYVLLVSTRPKCHSVKLMTSCFVRPFWDKCTEWAQNNVEPYKVKCTPYWLLVSLSVRFQSFSLYDHPVLSYSPFWGKCTNGTHKWPWTLQGHIYLICVLLVSRFPNFTPFRSMVSRFWVTGHFETSESNDHPKWHWTLQWSNVPHICITSVP